MSYGGVNANGMAAVPVVKLSGVAQESMAIWGTAVPLVNTVNVRSRVEGCICATVRKYGNRSARVELVDASRDRRFSLKLHLNLFRSPSR